MLHTSSMEGESSVATYHMTVTWLTSFIKCIDTKWYQLFFILHLLCIHVPYTLNIHRFSDCSLDIWQLNFPLCRLSALYALRMLLDFRVAVLIFFPCFLIELTLRCEVESIYWLQQSSSQSVLIERFDRAVDSKKWCSTYAYQSIKKQSSEGTQYPCACIWKAN